METIYKVEVGVLLDKDNEMFDAYSCVYDKQHGYYDENVAMFLDKDEAKKYAFSYVNNGVENTYGIVSELSCDFTDEQISEIKDQNYTDDVDTMFPDEYYRTEPVISTLHKKDGVVYIDTLFDFPKKTSYVK